MMKTHRGAPICHSEGGATPSRPAADSLAPTEESIYSPVVVAGVPPRTPPTGDPTDRLRSGPGHEHTDSNSSVGARVLGRASVLRRLLRNDTESTKRLGTQRKQRKQRTA